MKKIRNHLVGVDQGSDLLFSDYEDGGEMWAGNGARMHRRKIRFSEPFRKTPSVQVAISMIDTDHATNQRIDLTAENVTEKGFEVVFRTWEDTRIARIRADWLAIGELPQEDDWDLY